MEDNFEPIFGLIRVYLQEREFTYEMKDYKYQKLKCNFSLLRKHII